MFGYIRPAAPTLRVREFEYYRAAYCGLCAAHGRISGRTSRASLSYDAVFLALLRCAVSGETPRVVKIRCSRCTPGRHYALLDSPGIDFTAAAAAALSVYKLDDDICDEHGLYCLGARAARTLSRPWLARVRRRDASLAMRIGENLGKLHTLEAGTNADNVSADLLADSFGAVLADIASTGFTGDEAHVTSAVGRHVGRWIYCVDAIDDLTQDAKRSRFNPFLLMYGQNGPDDEEKITLRCLLDAEARAAYDALELLPRTGRDEAWAVLDNILTEGMPGVTAAVLEGRYRKPRRDGIYVGTGADGISDEADSPNNETRN